jgi:hypothetical protein
MAPHPGARAALRLHANGQGREGDIAPQQLGVAAVAGRGSRALQIIPGPLLERGDVFRCPGPQSPRHGGLLGTTCPPTGPLHRPIGPPGDLGLHKRLGTTEAPAQGIEQFIYGALADRFLRHLHLFPQRGKETVPPQILA